SPHARAERSAAALTCSRDGRRGGMVPPMYHSIFGQMKKTLGQLDKLLEMAAESAKARSFDPNLYLGFRLSPDQFPFSRQIQVTCDTAKIAASRMTGKEAPSHPDTEA